MQEHLHQALLDPYGTHIFTPEPKRDMVRWWKINSTTSELAHIDHITFAKGTGPRHGVFWSPEYNKALGVYWFVIGETDNRVYQYKIEHNDDGKDVKKATEIWKSDIPKQFGMGQNTTEPITGAEIAISVRFNPFFFLHHGMSYHFHASSIVY